MPTRQRQGAGRPRRIGQHGAMPARDAAGGEDHQGPLRVQRLLRAPDGQADGVAGALGLDPLNGDEDVIEPRTDPAGVGIGEIDAVGPHPLQHIVHRHPVGEASRMVDHHDQPAARRDALQAAGRHRQVQEARDVVHGLGPADRRHPVGHRPRLAVAQQGVEHRLGQGPGPGGAQARRPLGDQGVDDVGLCLAASSGGRPLDVRGRSHA